MPVRHTLRLAALLLALPAAAAARHPPDPFIDHGACPFECCTYRDWTTNKPVTLVDRPNSKAAIAVLPAKTTVHGVTGDVYSRPIRMVARRAFPDSPIRKGDVFYALHSSGEGFWAVWYRGKVYAVDMTGADDRRKLSRASPSWWAKVLTSDGRV